LGSCAQRKGIRLNKPVYKSEAGRNIVEAMYRDVLAAHSEYPFEQLFVTTDIAETHVLRFGDASKPPLVMIHGSLSNSAAWLGSISYFINDFCIYCVDIPGEPGLSEPVRCSLASDEPLMWLCSLLDRLGIDDVCLVTMSMGSWYGLNLLIHRPDRVRALSMITAGGIVPAKTSFIFKAILYMMLGNLGQKMLNRAVYHKAEVPPEVLEFQRITSMHFNPVIEALPIFSDDKLRAVTVPIQYFGGDHDALLNSVKTGDRLNKLIPHADIHILKDTGHVIIDQFPLVKRFLLSRGRAIVMGTGLLTSF